MTGSVPQIMQAGTMTRIEPWLNGVSIFILATIFLFWDASRAVYVLLSFAALGYLIKYRPQLPREQRLYSWPIIAYFGATFLSVVYDGLPNLLQDGLPDSGTNRLVSRFLLLLIAIPLVSLFYSCFDSRRNQWIKFVLGCIVLGLLALADKLVLDEYRAGGGHNEAVFGFSSAAMTSIVIASYHRFKKMRFGKFIFLAGVLMGLCAMFLSGTRSSWISMTVVVFIALMFYLDRISLSKRIFISIALVGCIATAGLTIPLVQNRIDQMIEMVTPYVKGEEQTKFNSLRYRVELWKAGWYIGMSDKIFGIGPGNVKKALKVYATENPHLSALRNQNHIHNQFLQTFAMSGLVGLVSLIALLSCHFWIFSKYLGKRYNPEVRSFALAGFLLLVAYIVYSIPGVPFYGKQYLLIYAFSSASIWGCLLAALQQSTTAIGNHSS